MSDRIMIPVLHHCLKLNNNDYFKRISQAVVHQDIKSKPVILNDIPTVVLLKLFEYLEVLSLFRMRLTCKRIQELIDFEYGLFLSLHSKMRSITNASVVAQLPLTNRNFIASPPATITPLNNLTSLNLAVKVSREDSQCRANSNELASALLILVDLPDTPCLKDFGFHLTLGSFIRFGEEAEFVLQACLLQFYKKRPSILECKAVVEFNSYESDEMLALPSDVVSVVENYGINEMSLVTLNKVPGSVRHIKITVDRSTSLVVMNINAPTLSLNDMPDLVLLTIFEFLDKHSLSQMRLVTRRIQELIDFEHGLYLSFDSKSESKAGWTTLKEKACCSLTLVDIHPDLIPLANKALLKCPKRLTFVHLRQVNIGLVHRFLSDEFQSLKSFEYGESKEKSSHSSDNNQDFILFITNAPKLKIPLNNLTSLHLVAKVWRIPRRLISRPWANLTDWTNALFILVALPDTPSLRKFYLNLTLETCVRLSESNKFFLQACLLEFLKKRPSLLELSVHVLSNTYEGEREQPLPQNILSSVCEKHGSSELKEFLQIMRTDETRQKIGTMIQNVGVVLNNLETLDVTLGSEWETTNALLSFMNHLQNLKTIKVQNCVKYSDEHDEDIDILGWKLLNPGRLLRGLPLLKTVTTLSLNVCFSDSISLLDSPEWENPPTLNDLLFEMPSLTNVEIIGLGCSTVPLVHPADIVDSYGTDTEDEGDNLIREVAEIDRRFRYMPAVIGVVQPCLRILKRDDMTLLKRLRKLRLCRVEINTNDFVNLTECSNLEELKLDVDCYVGCSLFGNELYGISSDIMFRLMASFRKLDKLEVACIMMQPSLSPEVSQWHWNILKQCGQVQQHPSPKRFQRFFLFSFIF